MKKKSLYLISVLLILALSVGGFFLYQSLTKGQEGLKEISFTIEIQDEQSKFSLKTEAITLKDALDDAVKEKKITYAATEPGFIETVNEYTAQWLPDNEWWKLEINGESIALGINDQPVFDKDSIRIALVKGYEE